MNETKSFEKRNFLKLKEKRLPGLKRKRLVELVRCYFGGCAVVRRRALRCNLFLLRKKSISTSIPNPEPAINEMQILNFRAQSSLYTLFITP